MFPFEYINAHWHDLGSDHFIAFCIGVNTALIGWPAFQDRVRYPGRELDPRLSSLSASILDRERHPTVAKTIVKTVVFLHRCGWPTIHGLALGAVFAGATMLYLKKSCPYDFLLLLPTIFQFGLSLITWGIVVAWSRLLRAGVRIFGPQIPSSTIARDQVAAFVSSTDQFTPTLSPNEQIAAQVVSQPRAGPGHRHRSSDNFSIKVPQGCYGLRWECPLGVKFSIKHSPQFGAASIIFLNLSKGSKTRVPPGGARDRLYVADPVGCKSEFVVWAIAQCAE
jgi:hypothetical protein